MIKLSDLNLGQKQYIAPHLHHAVVMARETTDPQLTGPIETLLIIPRPGRAISLDRIQRLIDEGWEKIHPL